MPLFDFVCDRCGKEKEAIVSGCYSAEECECGAQMRKLVGKSNFSLKGKGWFKDGYTN